MPFKKGHSGYKPKGAKGTKTEQSEALSNTLTGNQSEKFGELMDKLWEGTTKDQLIAAELYIKMVEYFKPKQSRVDTNIELNTNHIEFILPKDYED